MKKFPNFVNAMTRQGNILYYGAKCEKQYDIHNYKGFYN